MPNAAAKAKISIINMTLEQQVTSLELSKRLKELGVERESLFFWRAVGTKHDSWEISYFSPGPLELEPTSAFTVAELGEMLPIKVGDLYHEIETTHEGTGDWICRVVYVVTGKSTERFKADHEADSRAKMLIYLLENKLISI
jgi:hypothetical protein